MNPFAERKLFKHIKSLEKYINGGNYPPIQVELDITNKCTSDCPWCFGYVDRKWNDFMLFSNKGDDPIERLNSSIQGIKKLLDDFKTMGVKSVTWTGGGDPTCHKGLTELLEYSHSLGLDNGLITNGVIDVQSSMKFCKWIRFSVDAATSSTYKEMHGKDHFNIVVNNIKDLARVKKNCGHECTIGVAMLTGEKTSREIVRFARLWSDTSGIDYIQYRPLLDAYGKDWYCKSESIIKSIYSARRFDNRVVDSAAKYRAMKTGSNGHTKKCHGMFFETAIAADGKVYTCCHHKGMDKFVLGDLYRESIFEIWNRHMSSKDFKTRKECPAFCRHFGTNKFIENEVLADFKHENFI